MNYKTIPRSRENTKVEIYCEHHDTESNLSLEPCHLKESVLCPRILPYGRDAHPVEVASDGLILSSVARRNSLITLLISSHCLQTDRLACFNMANAMIKLNAVL